MKQIWQAYNEFQIEKKLSKEKGWWIHWIRRKLSVTHRNQWVPPPSSLIADDILPFSEAEFLRFWACTPKWIQRSDWLLNWPGDPLISVGRHLLFCVSVHYPLSLESFLFSSESIRSSFQSTVYVRILWLPETCSDSMSSRHLIVFSWHSHAFVVHLPKIRNKWNEVAKVHQH